MYWKRGGGGGGGGLVVVVVVVAAAGSGVPPPPRLLQLSDHRAGIVRESYMIGRQNSAHHSANRPKTALSGANKQPRGGPN